MGLRETADRVVADFEDRVLPEPTRRPLSLARLPGKIDAVVGMRRTGKTWFLFQNIRDLEAQGIDRRRVLYVNFEDERLLPLAPADLQEITEAFYRRHPESRRGPVYFFFDELECVPGWERFLRRLLDSEQAQIAISGSSSRLLAREIATSLRGRSLTTHLLPFGFRETLDHSGTRVPTKWPPPAATRSLLANRFLAFLRAGGFPEVQGVEEELRIRILQEYLDVLLFRDIVERHRVGDVPALRYLLRRFVADPATPFSVHRFFQDLKSQGLKASKDSLHEYVGHFEDAGLLLTVPIASRSEKARLVNPRKAYLADHALSTACRVRAEGDTGHLLENAVCVELLRRGCSISYVRTASGAEIDFLAESRDVGQSLIQVCADLSAPETRRREIPPLAEAMRGSRISNALMITLHDEDTIETDAGRVAVVPAWRWFLDPGAGTR